MKSLMFVFSFLIFCSFSSLAQKKLPAIKLKDLKGKTVSVNKINKEDITVFSFWATWCGPCLKELDAINEIYDEWQEAGIEVIAVSTDDSRTTKRVKSLVNGRDWAFNVLLDVNQKFKRALNVSNVPYMVAVKDNKIVYRHSNYTPGAEEEVLEDLKALQ